MESGLHRTAIYVRGDATRKGVGTALVATAEEAARRNGATEIHVDASLAAVKFYEANGFEILGSGEHTLRNGRAMACVFMRKALGTPPESSRVSESARDDYGP
jgi:GNAT superfamily N-acetyltransferase